MGPSGVEENLKGIQAENSMDKCTEMENDMMYGITTNILFYSIT